MSKSGQIFFYQKAVTDVQKLRKGNGISMDHFRRELFRKAFALKLQGKTEKEIIEYFGGETNG